MNKEQKIEFLKGVCNGTRSISELVMVKDETLLDYDFCSHPELYKLLKILRKFGDAVDKWPESDKTYFDWLKKDIPLRLPRPQFSERKKFNCRHLSGELIVIKYKDPSRKPLFQLTYGYNQDEHPNVIFPDHNRYFEHFDLGEWRPDIDFGQLSEDELEQMCIELISETELTNP